MPECHALHPPTACCPLLPSPAHPQGKRACHTGYRRTAGWTLPIGLLAEENIVSAKGPMAATVCLVVSKTIGLSCCQRLHQDAAASQGCDVLRFIQDGSRSLLRCCPVPDQPLPRTTFQTPQMPAVSSNPNVNADAESAAAFFSAVCAAGDTGALTSGGKWDGVCSACKVGWR